MRLSATFLTDVANVNAFREVAYVQMTEGDTLDVYLQLVDTAVGDGFNARRRYIPAVGATLSVEITALDDAKKVTKVCSQPFTQDGSIWKFTILPTDPVSGTKIVKLTLTEGAKVTRGVVQPAILVSSLGGLSN